jgi:hypothetical protein
MRADDVGVGRSARTHQDADAAGAAADGPASILERVAVLLQASQWYWPNVRCR